MFFCGDDGPLYILHCNDGEPEQSKLIFSLRPSYVWMEWGLFYIILLSMPMIASMGEAWAHGASAISIFFALICACKVFMLYKRHPKLLKSSGGRRLKDQRTLTLWYLFFFISLPVVMMYPTMNVHASAFEILWFIPIASMALFGFAWLASSDKLCEIRPLNLEVVNKKLSSPFYRDKILASCACQREAVKRNQHILYPSGLWHMEDDIPQALMRFAYIERFFKPSSNMAKSRPYEQIKVAYFVLLLGPAFISLLVLLTYPVTLEHLFSVRVGDSVLGAQILIWAELTCILYLQAGYTIYPIFPNRHRPHPLHEVIFPSGYPVQRIENQVQSLTSGPMLYVFVLVVTVIVPSYLQIMSFLL